LIDTDTEDNNKGEDEVEDNDIEEPQPLSPPAVIHFINIWKTFNKKEVLPRT
jgi:hypothetical protein